MESNIAAMESLLRELNETKRKDEDLVTELESNYEKIKKLEQQIKNIEFPRKRKRLVSLQDKQPYCNTSPPEPSQLDMQSPRDSCRSVERSNCHPTPDQVDQEEIPNPAKRNRACSLARPTQMQQRKYMPDSPSLLTAKISFEPSFGRIEEPMVKLLEDWLPTIAKDKLPLVTEICSRLWPGGPYAPRLGIYRFVAMIKTEPSREELSESPARDALKKLGYTWKLIIGNLEKVSPDYTLAYGAFINPSTSVTCSFTSDSSGISSDCDSELCSGVGLDRI